MEVTTIMTIEMTAVEKGRDVTLADFTEEKKKDLEKRVAEFLAASFSPSPDDIHVNIKTFLNEEKEQEE